MGFDRHVAGFQGREVMVVGIFPFFASFYSRLMFASQYR